MKKILVAGSINLDLVAQARRLPSSGETILGDSFDLFNGGKGANQAVGVARLNAAVHMMGCVGADWAGDRLRAALQSAGVGIEAVETVPGSSGVALIERAIDGDNSIIVIPGANRAVSPERVDTHLDLIRQSAMILAQLEIPIPAVERLAEHAWDAGVPLILDPAPAAPLSADLLRKVAWLTPNETEAQYLVGASGLTCETIAERLLDLGVRNVVLKLGDAGAYIAGADCAAQQIPTFPVHAVDTTAAGDCFNAAFAVALGRGESPEASARYAAAAAAISVTRSGAQPSLPTSVEVDRFLINSASNCLTGPSVAVS